jgi:hypothetical protein
MNKNKENVFIIYFIIMTIALGLMYLFLHTMVNNII